MSIGLTCGHLERGVCFKCAGQTRRLALQHAQETANAIARGAEDAAYARGIADGRARVEADLRAAAERFSILTASERALLRDRADRYERGEHEREGT